jgi:hypothetical protein
MPLEVRRVKLAARDRKEKTGNDLLNINRFLSSFRSYLKNVFWPNLRVGPSFQLLEILEYACGLNLGPALILNQNPIFEMASKIILMIQFLPLPAFSLVFAFSFAPTRTIPKPLRHHPIKKRSCNLLYIQ